MRYPRRIRFVAALVALFSLLFMQLAVAAYACPKLAPVTPAPMLDASGQAMADCPELDPQSASLCHTHSNPSGTQSLEKPPVPALQPFAAPRLVIELAHALVPVPAAVSSPAPLLRAASSSPPLAIRHCCFRL
jgi:hypothetical protein